jgi:glycosyltransferase involved in cell wall biosynthesis
MLPRLSVLLPYRNAEETLDECLLSICSQTFEDFELLAIDDASTDNSVHRLQAYAKSDPRIRSLENSRPGLVNALNLGLEQARSNIIVRMDADDRMRPERLHRQYRYLRANPEITLLGSQVRLFPDEQIAPGFREYITWQNRCLDQDSIAGDIYIESPFAHPSLAYRRDAVMKAGGYRHGDFPEDYELWLRLYRLGHRMAKLPEVLLEWRDSETRLSRTDPRCERRAFDRLRADYLARDPLLLKHRESLVIWGAGRKTRQRCRLLLEQGFRIKAWIDIDPKKIGNRIQGIEVRGPQWLQRNPRPFVLVYVNNHGARDLIGRELARMGYHRRRDYLMVG